MKVIELDIKIDKWYLSGFGDDEIWLTTGDDGFYVKEKVIGEFFDKLQKERLDEQNKTAAR